MRLSDPCRYLKVNIEKNTNCINNISNINIKYDVINYTLS